MNAPSTDAVGTAPRRWEHFEHGADIGVRGIGATKAEAFEQAALRHMLFSRFRVELHGTHLEAQASGEPTQVQRHQSAVEVKGATYTALRVARVDGGWLAQTVVDV